VWKNLKNNVCLFVCVCVCVCVCAGVCEFVEDQCLKRHFLCHLLFSYERSARYVLAVNDFGKCVFFTHVRHV